MDMPVDDNKPEPVLNVLGEPMEICCEHPVTGFYRNGRCDTGPDDMGVHTVCIRATSAVSYTHLTLPTSDLV